VRNRLTGAGSQSETLSSSRANRIVPRLAAFFLAAVILIYLSFIGIANWMADEYDDFGKLAHQGWHAVWLRLQWSPRPVSEPLFLLYGWTVNHFRHPLIVPFLAVLWCAFFAAGLVTYWQRGRAGNRGISRAETGVPELLIPLSLMASFVSGGAISEAFYWPAGAAECVPTVAASLLFFLQVARGRLATAGGRRLCGACLLVAACSSEMGAAFVLVYAGIQLLGRAPEMMKRGSSQSPRPAGWWLAPALVAVLVMASLLVLRLRVTERPVEQARAGNLVAAGIWHLSQEALGVGLRGDGRLFVNSRLLSEALLALGVALCWSLPGDASKQAASDTAAAAAAFLLASVVTIAAAEFHFHAVCCQQHETVRRCWILMGLTGIAIAAFGLRWAGRMHRGSLPALASLLLCAGVVVAWHTRPVLREYRIYGDIHYALDQNFHSGFDPGSDPMTFLLLPPGGIIYQQQVPPGLYTAGEEGPRYVQYVLRFFDKKRMIVRPADEWMPERRQR